MERTKCFKYILSLAFLAGFTANANALICGSYPNQFNLHLQFLNGVSAGYFVDGESVRVKVSGSWANVHNHGKPITLSINVNAYDFAHTVDIAGNFQRTIPDAFIEDGTNTFTARAQTQHGSCQINAHIDHPEPTVVARWEPMEVYVGQTHNFIWSSTNATSCVNAQGDQFAPSGSVSSTPTQAHGQQTSQLTCTGPGGSATAYASRTVSAYPAPTVSARWEPQEVRVGQTHSFIWSSTNATSCVNAQGQPFATSGSVTNTPTIAHGQQTSQLTCTGPGGSATAHASRNVLP